MTTLTPLAGRVAIITGAATDTGRASARLSASARAGLALADARATDLGETAAESAQAGRTRHRCRNAARAELRRVLAMSPGIVDAREAVSTMPG